MASTTKNQPAAPKAAPSMKLVFSIALVMALIGAASGYMTGSFALPDGGGTEIQQKTPVEKGGVKLTEDTPGNHAGDATNGTPNLVFALDPIVTNIAKPSDVWVRFEAVLKAREPLGQDVPDQIHQDILAFFHTMRLSELTGASAFIDLKAELLSRANTRADGKIDAIYVKTFIFE